jgi:hypothetical protein
MGGSRQPLSLRRMLAKPFVAEHPVGVLTFHYRQVVRRLNGGRQTSPHV